MSFYSRMLQRRFCRIFQHRLQQQQRNFRMLKKKYVSAYRRRGACMRAKSRKQVSKLNSIVGRLAKFQVSQCTKCGAFRDQSEKYLCCSRGNRIVSDEMLPPPKRVFTKLRNATENFTEKAAQLNNLCCFSALASDRSAANKTMWDTQALGRPAILHGNGRMYHRFMKPKNQAHTDGMHGLRYYTHHPPSLANCSEDDVRKFRLYLRRNNAIGQVFSFVSNAIKDASLTDFKGYFKLKLKPGDEPTNPAESFNIRRSEEHWAIPPNTEAIAFPSAADTSHYSIFVGSRVYELAQYPLLYPSGQGGYSYNDPPRFEGGQKVKSVLEFFKYIMYQRSVQLAALGKLFDQYTLDSFSRWEELLLLSMKRNASVNAGISARIAKLKEVQAASHRRRQGSKKIGRRLAIPASIPGSPAYQRDMMQDGMAVFAALGQPHLFVTFTANERWPEFIEAVRKISPSIASSNISATRFPHLFARVFRRKLQQLEADITSGKIFGYRIEHLQRCVEFQKRGIPHAHIIFRLEGVGELEFNGRFVDTLTTTRLFFHEQCPKYDDKTHNTSKRRIELQREKTCTCAAHDLSRKVAKKLIHSCKVDKSTYRKCTKTNGKCKWGYPHKVCEHTWKDQKGFWHYRRKFEEDARVVPYNPAMLLRYDSHINVEVSATVRVVTYLRKYLSKVPDHSQASLATLDKNPFADVEQWMKCRHIAEAAMRLLQYPLNRMTPSVTRLPVHLPNEHSVISRSGEFDDTTGMSKLLRYFARDQHPDLDNLTYSQYYTIFNIAKDAPKTTVITERMHEFCAAVHDKLFTKRFYTDTSLPTPFFAVLRSLRHVTRLTTVGYNDEVKGLMRLLSTTPTRSFEELRKVRGVQYETFVDAARAAGCWGTSDDNFRDTLRELINPNDVVWVRYNGVPTTVPYASCNTPFQLRIVFCSMLIAGASGKALFDDFYFWLSLDLPLGIIQRRRAPPLSDEQRADLLLVELARLLAAERRTPDEFGLPAPSETNIDVIADEQQRYDVDTINQQAALYGTLLDKSQRNIVDTIRTSVTRGREGQRTTKLFFLHALAGRGKTEAVKVLTSILRRDGFIVSICSPTAMGANNHLGGMTAHGLFGLPIVDDDDFSNAKTRYSENSYHAKLLDASNLIVIDEVAMLHRAFLQIINSFLQQVMDSEEEFGGKVVLLTGDFCQLPPVAKTASPEEISIASDPLLKNFMHLHLTRNHRQQNRPFANWCDGLAKGFGNNGYYEVELPDFIARGSARQCVQQYLQQAKLDASTYSRDSLLDLMDNPLYNSFIVAYTNSRVDYYNEFMTKYTAKKLSAKVFEIDALEEVDQNHHGFASAEFMSQHDEAGTPKHKLLLFIGSRTVLIRNFMPSQGLVNNASFIVTKVNLRSISVINITRNSPHYGEEQVLFRFKFNCKYQGMFTFARYQLPVAVAFAGTVHKLQGQTIPRPGLVLIDATDPSFAPALFYVAVGRVKDPEQLIIATSLGEGSTQGAVVSQTSQFLANAFAHEKKRQGSRSRSRSRSASRR